MFELFLNLPSAIRDGIIILGGIGGLACICYTVDAIKSKTATKS